MNAAWRREHRVLAVVVVVAIAIGVVLTVGGVLLKGLTRSFSVASGSMEPTLQIDDRILTNKSSDPARGEIIVIDDPRATEGFEHVIKRVIAFGGETVTLRDGAVYVDDRRLEEPYLAKGTRTEWAPAPRGCDDTADDDAENSCVVPKDSLFVMGDNRAQSKDSRSYGPVAADSVEGSVFWVVWPLDRLGSP